jgi:hypothetical protein
MKFGTAIATYAKVRQEEYPNFKYSSVLLATLRR